MASPGKSVYFPPLAACLNGDVQLLSWERVAQELEKSARSLLNATFSKYIQDPAAIQVLTNCFTPSKPSAQSKAELETLTSAINVTSTPDGRYDIKELKEDALWLSVAAQIDELQSLRLTVLEWQSRPSHQALQSIGKPESGISDPSKTRRQHLLEICFVESQWVLKCVELLTRWIPQTTPERQEQRLPDDARISTAQAIRNSWKLHHPKDSTNDGKWLLLATSYLQKQIDSIWSRSDIMSQGSLQDYATEQLHTLCTETAILCLIHGMQIVLLIQWSLPRPSPSSLVLAWFSWMDTNSFYKDFLTNVPPVFFRYQPQIRELVILCSLAFIDLAASNKILGDLAASSIMSGGMDSRIYLQSINCIEELNQIFLRHIELRNEVVAPVGIAWFSLLNVIQIHASRSIEHRENRQAQKAIDQYGAGQYADHETSDKASTRRSEPPQRRHSFGSDSSGQATLFEEIDELVRNHPAGEDTIKQFGQYAAVELAGFSIVASSAQTFLSRIDPDAAPGLFLSVTQIALQFFKTAMDMGSLSYSQFALDMIFAVLLGDDGHWRYRATYGSHPYPFQTADQLLEDDPLLRDIMATARGRFPLEGTPFIQLCRVLLPVQGHKPDSDDLLLDVLSNLGSFTALITEPQVAYDLIGEGDHLQLHLLDSVSALAMAFPELLQHLPASEDGLLGPLTIHAGSVGHALRDEKPIIALWQFRYSALRFCGLTLQLHLRYRARAARSDSGHEYSNIYALNTEIVALLGTWLMQIATSNTRQFASDKAQALLADMSDDLDRNQDVIAIICELLEGELYKTDTSPEVAKFISRCLQFLVALARVMPARVWSFLSRSGLLGLHGQESRLTAIIAATEISTGTYNILLSSIQLLDVLIDNAAFGVSSHQGNSTALKRFRAADSQTNGSGVQNVTVKRIIQQFTRILVDVIEVSSNWNFQLQEHKLSVTLGILAILRKLISYTFNHDDESSPETRLSADIAPATDYVVDSFLSESANDTLLQPLFQQTVQVAATTPGSLSPRVAILRQYLASSILLFFAQLARLNKSKSYATSKLTTKIYENITVLVGLFVSYPELRLPVVRVLEATIRDHDMKTQPKPILGALQEESAKAFVECLSTLALSGNDPTLAAAIWSLFSAALACHQQWFTIYLLLGKTPKDALKSKSTAASQQIIRLALKKLRHIDNIDQEELVELLDFVAHCASVWTSVIQDLKDAKECKDACLKYLAALQPPKKDGRGMSTKDPIRFQIAAHIVSIVALLAYHSNQQNDKTTLKHILPSIKFLVEHGASSPDYNVSLHHGLQRNFEELFPGSSLQHFKRTSFSEPVLGDKFYYDIQLGDRILYGFPAWRGKDGRGFIHEFIQANVNLSLVEAQVNLFHAWKSLAMELGECLSSDPAFQNTMITIIKNCLVATSDATTPEPVFKKLRLSQADLAFTLLQQLLQETSRNKEIKGILDLAWTAAQTHVSDLGISLAGPDTEYVRTLLRVLYLALCAQEDSQTQNAHTESTTTGAILDILEVVVARGFRSLVAMLHEDSSQVSPQDFALVIAILRASLKLPGVQAHSERLLAHFVDDRTIQYAGTLISWSDQLASNGDPIFGGLSITFLLELSSIQALAEALVVSGIYSQISNTTLFSRFRQSGGCGPFDQPTRMYDIWTNGYLPLALNVTGAIGSPVAIEIATTFEQFAAQLKRASTQFDPKLRTSTSGRVTLSMITEAHSLALLNLVLGKFREAGSSAGIVPTELPQLQWDGAAVKEDLESLLGRRQYLRDCIVPSNQREEQWCQQKASHGDDESQNQLEAKIVDEIKATLALMGGIE